MDSPKVEMLRSVKGKDMLLINDYLYHYDDRNSKAYRWVCSRRKDSIPCRVRIYTTLIDEWDLTRHKLETMVGEHPHGPAEQGTILRAREKKRQADAEGLPCTLSNKSLKRKFQRLGDKKNVQKKRKNSDGNTSDDDEEDDTNDIIVMDDVVKVKPKTEDKHVMMLKTTKGYHMIAVEGCVYRLDGKSMFSCTYRWKCFRSKDLQCTGRIYTECLANGMHRFKPFRVEENKHNHQPYSDPKIDALIKRNNIKILQGKDEIPAVKVAPSSDNKKSKGKVAKSAVQQPLSVGKGGGNVLSISADINLSPKPSLRRERAQATAAMYRCIEDPLNALSEPKDGDVTKFFFLPSLKGNRILVLDNMIFHYDSRGSINDRAYWTCLFRRDKKMKCNCRLTTENTGASTQIVKVSGDHTHALNHREQIEKRLKMDITIKGKKASVKNENKISMEDENSLYKSDDDGDNFDNDEHYGEQEDTKDNTVDLSEFLKMKVMKVMKKEKESRATATNESSTLDDQEIAKAEYKTETDPFHETIEYVEMERVNTSQYHADYESEQDQDEEPLPSVSQRPKRKRRKPLKYSDDEDADYKPPKLQLKHQSILGKISTNTPNISSNPDNIDINKTSKLRSAKGGELLCVDGFIYHLKSISPTTRTYWACIKSKDRNHKCPARVTTITTEENKLKVVHISNSHSHGVSEDDIKKRLFNEFAKSSPKLEIKSKHIMEKTLSELNPEFAEMLGKHSGSVKRDRRFKNNMKLYAVSDGPPSLAVRMCLKALNLPYELCNVDYIASEHMSEEYAKMNPQKEIPVLDDDGFFLSESIAIMQFLCDKYATNTSLYPAGAKERALVNHRLCFNMSFYYSSISAYTMAPIFFDYQRTEMGLKKVKNALAVFETYLKRLGTKYAASNNVTIADYALVSSTLCLEAIGFDLTPYPLIKKWYEGFKKDCKTLWEIANGGMQEIKEFEKNPPDLSHMNHPFHPTRKPKV